eukprot:TRINITY_DN8947_c0_g1_i1.p1 TRINITY_DN8947_c0_g1~~TRINITY_DN8947_c0_g1_i1.p1  ORF type:complete len:216 (+),score=34.92 TRINITY_DN8947_c0_g1_i1:85-732(+)
MDDQALNNNLLFRLWRVKVTVSELCRDRGFVVDDEDINMTLDDFKQRFGSAPLEGKPSRSDLNTTFTHEDGNSRISIYLPDGAKVGVSVVRDFVVDMSDNNVTNAIVIVQKALTSSAMKAVRECNAAGNFMQVFEETELVVNITKHELVPRHQVQTSDEKKELLERYKLKEQQLPRIKMTDPIARYYGLRRGQVVKITRENSPTAGRYVSYRLVY